MAQYRATASSKESSNAGESDEASTCVICLESLEKSLAALPCGHVFHHICAKKAIAHHPACPVCRFQASPRNVVRLYLSFGAEATRDDNSSCNAAVGTNRFKPTTVSRLPERLREMKSELDRAHQIQRMTSSHSFRLESDVVRLKQRLEQTTRRMQHIQSQLESAEAQLRIATTIYTQHNQSKRALTEFDRKVRTTAEWMLEKIRERQQFRCPSCASEWAEMKRITRELAAVGSGSRTCCPHHGRQRSMRTTGRAPPTSYSRGLRQPRLAAQHGAVHHVQDQCYCDF